MRRLFRASPVIVWSVLMVSMEMMIGVSAHNPWEGFHNLSGCHAGQHHAGLAGVKKYLRHFGYIPSNITSFDDDFDDVLRSAILAYQEQFHLNATGTLDPSTVDVMVRPRCGVADVLNGTGHANEPHGRNLYRYFDGTPVWTKRRLTYAFNFTSDDIIEESVLRRVISRAFARWSEVTTLTFAEISSTSGADIAIGFFRGDHADGEPFDGQLGTLAHAFAPTIGLFHLDADERWVAVGEDAASPDLFSLDSAIDLESVAVHEIGHLLGLGHSTVEGSIMYPVLETGKRRVKLAQDDVQGIQNLYGPNPNFRMDSPPTTATTAPKTENETSGGGVPVTRAVRSAIAIVGAVALAMSTFRS